MARPSASSNTHFANGPTLAPTRTLINDLMINWVQRHNWNRPHGRLKANTPINRLGQLVEARQRPTVQVLTVTDEFTKEGLAIDVDGRIRSARPI
jgi:hypothetical protein